MRVEYESKCDLCNAKKYDRISPLPKELKKLEKLIYLRSATLAFKCITGSALDYPTSKFKTSVGEKLGTHNPYIFRGTQRQFSEHLLQNFLLACLS